MVGAVVVLGCLDGVWGAMVWIGPIAKGCGHVDPGSNLGGGMFFSRHVFSRWQTKLKAYCLLQHMFNKENWQI